MTEKQGSERVVDTQVLVLSNEGDKTEVWNACYELNYDDEKAYAILENPNSSYPMSESDYSDFQIDNTDFWEFVEFIYDQIERYNAVETLVTDLNSMIMSDYDVEEIVDRDDHIYVDNSVAYLFKEIEKTIDNYRYPGTDYVLQDVYVIYTDIDDITEPFNDAIVIVENDMIETTFSHISKYNLTIRKIQEKSRQQLAAVTTLQRHGLYYKNTEYIVFLEPKRDN